LAEKFWESVYEYTKIGFDPLRWVPTCSNEVNDNFLNSVLIKIKRSSVKLDLHWFDAYYYSEKKIPEITRRVYDFNDPRIEKEVDVKHALSLFRIYNETGEDSLLLTEAFQKFLRGFQSKVLIRKNTITLTSHQNAQFALLDYVEIHRGDKAGFTVANNSATQLIDPTTAPDSEVHSNIAFAKAIDHLNLLGCTLGFKLFPIYDAPTENTLDKIRTNLDTFTSRYNIAMEDYSSLKIGKLFFGTTAIANTLKELPTRYDQVDEGMQIIISNKLGAISALSLHMLIQMDPNNLAKFGHSDIEENKLSNAKDETIKTLSEPRFSLGRIISKYCPDFGMAFDKNAHIVAVYPATMDGIFAIAKLAELTNSCLVINEIPMIYDEIAKYVTKEFLIDNSTVPSNGCHLIIATKDIANLIIEDLRKHTYESSLIGFVSKKEKPVVRFSKNITEYVASKTKLSRSNSIIQLA
jgi:selenophosphate synthase